jgi:DNA-directed RNA polymerase specialized sigma24 family protein
MGNQRERGKGANCPIEGLEIIDCPVGTGIVLKHTTEGEVCTVHMTYAQARELTVAIATCLAGRINAPKEETVMSLFVMGHPIEEIADTLGMTEDEVIADLAKRGVENP